MANGAQRGHHDRIDDPLDVGPPRVVGAELGALGGVQRALEERPEDRRLDRARCARSGAIGGGRCALLSERRSSRWAGLFAKPGPAIAGRHGHIGSHEKIPIGASSYCV